MRFLSVLCIIILAVSCATFTSTEGPDWTREPPVHPGMVVFVSSGTGADENDARIQSYRDILDEAGEELGLNLTSIYFREFLSNDSVTELSLNVTNTYTSPGDRGVIYYTMAEMPTSVFDDMQTEERAEAVERTAAIGRFLDSSLEHYKENEDTKAIDDLLTALDYALSGPVTDESITPDSILSKAEEYLGNLRISQKNDDGIIVLTMKRSKGLFHPYVVGGAIKGTYEMLLGNGELSESSEIAVTDRKGRASFPVTNPYTVSGSDIVFTVGVSEKILSSVIQKAPEGFMDDFLSILSQTAVSVHYERGIRYENLIIGVVPYDENGNIITSEEPYEAFSSFLRASGNEKTEIVRGEGDEEYDALGYLRAVYSDRRYYGVLRIGVADKEYIPEGVYVQAQSRLSLFEGKSDEAIMTLDSEAVGKGPSDYEAEVAAVTECARRTAGLLLSHLQ